MLFFRYRLCVYLGNRKAIQDKQFKAHGLEGVNGSFACFLRAVLWFEERPS